MYAAPPAMEAVTPPVPQVVMMRTSELLDPGPPVVMMRSSEPPDLRAEFHLMRRDIEQLCENDRCQSQDIQTLRQQIGALTGEIVSLAQRKKNDQPRDQTGDLVSLARRLAILEESPLLPRMQQAEINIDTSITAINDLTLRVEALEAFEWLPQETDLERSIREIDARGNIRFDLESGRMQVLREIMFIPIKSSDKPVAKLRDPQVAAEVIDDIAALAALFEDNVLTVEGHTGGGENEFWQQLADDRARLVGQELTNRGHRAHLVKTLGMPGKTGLNKSEVVVHLTKFAPEIGEVF